MNKYVRIITEKQHQIHFIRIDKCLYLLYKGIYSSATALDSPYISREES
jgi:hypothetical protein